jgi:gliding motility-associated-like protein
LAIARYLMNKSSILLLLFILTWVHSFATHNRAGEITYKHLAGLKYEVTITTYANDNAADRSFLEIFWGDGSSDTLQRSNGTGQQLGNNIKKNLYIGEHTYNGPGKYTLYMEDPNRNAGIINIPGSVNIPFYIETELIISPFGVGNFNNSPVLLNPPLDDACVNRLYIHNPGATDPDGDSLSYSLINVRGADGEEVLGYYIPGNVSINAITGDLIWNTPNMVGEFNFAILIQEWRRMDNHVRLVGSVLRDMQVTVGTCTNNPPIIAALKDTCVEAGINLSYTVSASDPDNHRVTLSATGGPFIVSDSPANFPGPIEGVGTVSGVLTWSTKCSHVRHQPYSVLFKAVDSPLSGPSLSDYKTLNIKVVGPSPKNPSANSQGNSIVLNWDQSICDEVKSYKIYRRKGLYGFNPASCELGVPAYTGYSLIANVNGLSNTTYTDTDVIHGEIYCYMIVAVFPDNSESYASVEICAELTKDVPIITNVSVNETGNPGENYIAWSKPTELDTLVQHPGPFRYLIYRADGLNGNNFTLIDSTDIALSLDDTIYLDKSANTTAANNYRIDLYHVGPSGYYLLGNTHRASSVFLSIKALPAGNSLELNWDFNVPWSNYEYTVYRQNTITGVFDSIGTSATRTFIDTGLVNLEEYCYYVKSTGEYSITGTVNPIVNLSQLTCGTPQDTEPPCPPVVNISGNCDLMKNTLSWGPQTDINCENDGVKYYIYFTPVLNGAFELIATIEGNNSQEFVHERENSVAGCYYVTAIDIYNNESIALDTLCVDNCPVYELPNVFSPDSDGINDFFRPFPYRFIESVELTVFNRWGQPVFYTQDPDVNWNSIHQETKKPCVEGVYFYVCTVNELRLTGIEPRVIKGSLHLFRNSDQIPQLEY